MKKTTNNQAKTKITNETSEGQRILSDFVNKEVLACQSSLVEELLNKEIFSYDDIINFYEYECQECLETFTENQPVDMDGETDQRFSTYCPDCYKKRKNIDDLDELDTKPQEIFEWWLCTGWLLDKLEKQGEPILRTDFGAWWGRTCCGQAIHLDHVIENIYNSL